MYIYTCTFPLEIAFLQKHCLQSRKDNLIFVPGQRWGPVNFWRYSFNLKIFLQTENLIIKECEMEAEDTILDLKWQFK